MTSIQLTGYNLLVKYPGKDACYLNYAYGSCMFRILYIFQISYRDHSDRSCFVLYVNYMFRYFFLNFIDVPYQPLLHSNFTGGCSFINVTWSPPAFTAKGGSVTGYLAEIYTAIDWDWINSIALNNSKTTSCSFTQLEPNSKYRIRVKAKNKLGYGWPTETLEANTFQTGNLSHLLPVVL